MRRTSWHLKSNHGCGGTKSKEPASKKSDSITADKKPKSQKTQSIGKDLDSIASSLHKLEQNDATNSSGAPAFGKAMLRPTAHGQALKEGNEIRSRRYRRAQELSAMIQRKADQISEVTLVPSEAEETGDGAAKKTPDKVSSNEQSSPGTLETEEEEPKVSSNNCVEEEESPLHDSIQSLDHNPKEPVDVPSPTSRTISQTRPVLSPTRIKFSPTGPSEALREGKEAKSRYLRLLELSELMIEKKQMIIDDIQSPVSRKKYRWATKNQNGDVIREEDEQSNSSESTDISSGDDISEPDSMSGGNKCGDSDRFHYGDESLRPSFVRGMSFDRIEGDVPVSPHASDETPTPEDASSPQTSESDEESDDESAGPSVNALRPSFVRGLSFENAAKKTTGKTRRGGRRPKANSNEEESDEEDDTPAKPRRRGGRRPCRPKRTTLRPPGDTSSSENDEVDHEETGDLRKSLQFKARTFRRKPFVYNLPKKKRDFARKITRKKSIRPKMAFLKILPGMRPTVKGLLQTDDTSDESDASSVTPTTNNRSGQGKIKECFQSEIAHMGKDDPVRRRRKKSWIPPRRTPVPAHQKSTNGRANGNKPEWIEPCLKPTGQKEKMSNLAKPITFPIKEEDVSTNWRAVLRPTEQGQAIQTGLEIRSRRARRLQELSKFLLQQQE